jgi:hypothetical protein
MQFEAASESEERAAEVLLLVVGAVVARGRVLRANVRRRAGSMMLMLWIVSNRPRWERTVMAMLIEWVVRLEI